MQNLFIDTRPLDNAVRQKYNLTEQSMMECAASALKEKIILLFSKKTLAEKNVLILCGAGNNGGDGYALARLLANNNSSTCSDSEKITPLIIQTSLPKTEMCKYQAERAYSCGVKSFCENNITSFDDIIAKINNSFAVVIVDCIFGAGFHGSLDKNIANIIDVANSLDCIRIACDVPTGVASDGAVDAHTFKADYTVTMGALKSSLYSDGAKDFCGEISCADLGVSREQFESCQPVAHLLEQSDLVLPHRTKNLVNKGSFGHAAIICGEKAGAAVIAGSAALRYGAGLVTLVKPKNSESLNCFGSLPTIADTAGNIIALPELMTSNNIPDKATAIAFGMGLGRGDGVAQPYFDWILTHKNVSCIIDADVFYDKNIINFLNIKSAEIIKNLKSDFLCQECGGVVLTPHPKEFQSLLEICGFGIYSVNDCVNKRIELVTIFCKKFPGIVILVKGANPLIGQCGYFNKEKSELSTKLFINPLGKPCLAKAGSGDVLSGLICSLLAQSASSYCSPNSVLGHALFSAIQGSLAHACASRLVQCDYAMTPFELINCTSKLD